MILSKECVSALFGVAGLAPDADELEAIAADYPMLREQADALHRAAAQGVAVDASMPTRFTALGTGKNSRPGGTAKTIQDVGSGLRAGATSAVELTADIFARIARCDDSLGAFVCTFRDTAIEAAHRADRELASGQDRGPLHGIPLAIKDVIATVEGPTRANSMVPPPRWQSQGDALVVARLREAGAIIVGKATTSEFALGLHDPAKGFPQPRNAWDTKRFPGASSSGTAIAVASGMALGGLGTDTGGSIRHPAACNGVTGLKPSLGRVPTSGVVPLAWTLDTVGPIGRSARDCALLLEAMVGNDPIAGGSRRESGSHFVDALDGCVRGLRIGWPKRYFFDAGNVADSVKLAVEAAMSTLLAAGAVVSEVDLPNADMAKMANHIVLLSEGFTYHRRDLAERWTDYGRFLRALLARGALFTAADYVQAKRTALTFTHEVASAMRDYDVLITPTLPTGADLFDATDPTMMDRWSSAMFTPQWNIIGLPACAVPVGFDANSMPLSMQIIGRLQDDATVLRVADAYQRLTGFHLMTPKFTE